MKRIKDLLSITKRLTVFDCYDSQAEGVTSFSKRAGVRVIQRGDRAGFTIEPLTKFRRAGKRGGNSLMATVR